MKSGCIGALFRTLRTHCILLLSERSRRHQFPKEPQKGKVYFGGSKDQKRTPKRYLLTSGRDIKRHEEQPQRSKDQSMVEKCLIRKVRIGEFHKTWRRRLLRSRVISRHYWREHLLVLRFFPRDYLLTALGIRWLDISPMPSLKRLSASSIE